jgi:hypothetical protein
MQQEEHKLPNCKRDDDAQPNRKSATERSRRRVHLTRSRSIDEAPSRRAAANGVGSGPAYQEAGDHRSADQRDQL